MNGAFIIILLMVLVINLALIAWAITDIMQRKSVKYLPKPGWIVLIAFVLFGSIIYLAAGRGKD